MINRRFCGSPNRATTMITSHRPLDQSWRGSFITAPPRVKTRGSSHVKKQRKHLRFNLKCMVSSHTDVYKKDRDEEISRLASSKPVERSSLQKVSPLRGRAYGTNSYSATLTVADNGTVRGMGQTAEEGGAVAQERCSLRREESGRKEIALGNGVSRTEEGKMRCYGGAGTRSASSVVEHLEQHDSPEFPQNGSKEHEGPDGEEKGGTDTDGGRRMIMKICSLGRGGKWEEALEFLRVQQQATRAAGTVLAIRGRRVARDRGQRSKSAPCQGALEKVAYNAVLSAMSKAGRWKEALSLMREMKTKGLERDTITFSSTISACGRGRKWKEALQVLEELRSEGVPPNSFVYCSAIDACSKGGQWQKALQLLDEMEHLDRIEPNIRCMNSAIDACAKDGPGMPPTVQRTYPPKRGQAANWHLVLRFEAVRVRYLEKEFQEGVVAGGEESGSFGGAVEDHKGRLETNQVSFLSAISACARAADSRGALRLLGEMVDAGVTPDTKCYSSAISACGTEGRWQQAMVLLNDMRAAGFGPNVVCYNAAISACGKSRQWQRAVSLLETMRDNGVAPDVISYNAAIDACVKSERWRQALAMFLDMRRAAEFHKDKRANTKRVNTSRIPAPDATSYGSAIAACSRGKQWRLALQLLDDMDRKGVSRTEAVFQATMTACAKVGRWRECTATLRNMRASGLQPRVMAYNSVVTAFGRAKEWRRGLAVLGSMSSMGVTLDCVTFNAAMDACAQAGRWREALNILEFMRDPESDAGSEVSDMMEALRSEAERPAPRAEDWKPFGSVNGDPTAGRMCCTPRPDGVSFHVVVKALSRAGLWEKALDVLEELRAERQWLYESRATAARKDPKAKGIFSSDLVQPLDVERFRLLFRDAKSEGVGVTSKQQAMLVLSDIERQEHYFLAKYRC